ncbi:hypothetical protein KRP22_014363 [Phytophthora ramorum]|uniref:RxLR effector protein 24 n=1 Tax=Phytophthora ramorum TaxID=164328 RepID=UPI003099EE8A|nr:RxLR effector protein 24 [Phytophthora ramorum]KAH7501576.1 RxLR effector protein 24 [Phytophthora ramorum]
MRLLLWALLVTLVTLFASTDAVSFKIANANTMKTSKVESIETPALPACGLSSEHTAVGKRSLRVRGNDDVPDDDGSVESYTDEERALSISNIITRMKTAVGKRSNSMAQAVTKLLNKWNEAIVMKLYRMGATPATVRGTKKFKAFYKEWYDKNVAAGVIKALD